MSFGDRLEQTGVVVDALNSGLWGQPVIWQRLAHVPYGAEQIIPKEIHELIRHTRTETTRYIRFSPDAFIVDRRSPEKTYLLEYKCTQTPLYSANRIQTIRGKSGRKDLDWPDIGQWEAEAYDNYNALSSLRVRVAVVNYCAYHERLLVCDFVDRVKVLHRDQVTTETLTGSRTPFVNFDLAPLRSLEDFLIDEHGLDQVQITQLCKGIKDHLRERLPIKHSRNSPFNR